GGKGSDYFIGRNCRLPVGPNRRRQTAIAEQRLEPSLDGWDGENQKRGGSAIIKQRRSHQRSRLGPRVRAVPPVRSLAGDQSRSHSGKAGIAPGPRNSRWKKP